MSIVSKDLQEIRSHLNNLGRLKELAEPDIKKLADAGVDSFESLIETLGNPNCGTELRRICAWALGQLRDTKATTHLLKAFTEDDAILRWEVAKSLGIIGSKSAVLPLIDHMTNAENPDEQSAAAYALGLLGDKRAFGPLLNVLEERNESAGVRGQAAEALARLQCKEAVPALIQGLKDDSAEVRFWCAFACGELGDRRALQALEQLAATDDTTLSKWGSISNEAENAVNSIKSAIAGR